MPRILVLLVTLLAAAAVQAGVVHVPMDQPTIQGGVNQAVEGDTILVAASVYTGTGNHDIDIAKNVTVMSEDGPASTVIDCEGNGRAFYIHDGTGVGPIIQGFTIKNGDASGAPVHNWAGGAIECWGYSGVFRECVFLNNTATYGGALYFNPSLHHHGPVPDVSYPSVVNCTFVDNDAPGYGSVYYENGSIFTTFRCCILYGNTGSPPATTGLVTFECCDVYGNSHSIWIDESQGNFSANPFFCDVEDDDFSISDCSPCLRSGDYCTGLVGALGVGCNIDCPARNAWYVAVTGSDLTGDGSFESPFATIQNALDHASSGDTVYVQPGDYFELVVLDSVSVFLTSTEGSENTFLSGPSAGFTFSTGMDNTSKISGFTIRNVANLGSAVVIPPGNSPTIQSCVFRDNNGPDGAAIHTMGDHVAIRGCSFFNNHSTWEGGAIAIKNSTGVEVDSCVFAGNSAYASAGAVYMRFCDSVSLTRNVAYNNIGGGMGGGFTYIYTNDNIVVRDNTIVGNSTPDRGAGITYWNVNGLDIRNNIIAFGRVGSGVFAGGANSLISLEYNDVYGNAGGDYVSAMPGTGSISQDPMLVDTALIDLRVWCESPCVDAGDPDAQYNDPDGSRCDMGALGCREGHPMGSPELIFPVGDDLTIYDMNPTFSWTAVAGSESYHLELSLDESFSTVPQEIDVTGTECQLPYPLSYGTHYWWRVTAIDSEGDSGLSEAADFWTWMLGDVNESHTISLLDIMRIVDYLFITRTPIEPLKAADINGDCRVTLLDVMWLVAKLFITEIELHVGCE